MLIRIAFSALLTLMFCSCMLTGKMDKIVSEHYGGQVSLRMPDNITGVIIKTEGLPRVNGYCKSRYNRFFTIPLLVYTYSNEAINCQINPNIYASFISKEITESLNLHPEKKENRILEVTITSLPSSFAHKFNNHFVFVQFLFNNLTLSFTRNELFNTMGAINLNYIVKDKSTLNIINSGTVTVGIPNLHKTKFDNIQRKRFVKYYVEAFDNELISASKTAVRNLIEKL